MCRAAGDSGSMGLRSSFIVVFRYIAVRLHCQGWQWPGDGSIKPTSRIPTPLESPIRPLPSALGHAFQRDEVTTKKNHRLPLRVGSGLARNVGQERKKGASVCRSRGRSEYGNLHARREAFRAINALGGFLVVRFLRFKNVGDEFLRVAVDKGK